MYEKTGYATAALYALAGAGALWLFLRYLLPWTAPFLIAFLAAAALEPAVLFLTRRWRLSRASAAGMCTVALLTVTGLLIYLLTGRLFSELKTLAVKAPELFESITEAVETVRRRVSAYIDAAPAIPARYLISVLDSFTLQLEALPAELSGRVLMGFSALAAKAPSIFLFSATCAIGVYFCSEAYPDILRFFSGRLPLRWRNRVQSFWKDLRATLLRWLKVQFIMMLIIFATLLAAFALMRVSYPLLLAAVAAVVDALPVLGTGTVLLPWAAYCLITGEVPLGLGLIITYVLVTMLRNMIQAKLLGDHLGLHPLVTLLSIYLGFSVMGVWGMILFPILAVTFKQFYDRCAPWLRRNAKIIEREGLHWRE